MKNLENIKIEINPIIADDELYSFYQRNHICEEGYVKELACKPLHHSSLIVAAFEGDRPVGIARAMLDGLSAVIMEFCLELEYQGTGLMYENGSIIGKDELGLGKKLGDALVNELTKMGADFISLDIFDEYEGDFYRSLGFVPKENHAIYYIDKRPHRDDERYITRPKSGDNEDIE